MDDQITLVAPESGPSVEPQGTQEHPASPPRILVLEDEDLVARSIERVLRKQGYAVEVANAPGEALSRFRQEHFDTVVSDINLPGMSGIDFLREIRTTSSDTPVLLITGRPTVDSAVEAVELGAFLYLTKPFRSEELRIAVSKAVGHGRMARMRSEAQRVAESLGFVSGNSELYEQLERAMQTLWIAYQPIIDRNWTIIGYEALLRCDETSLRDPRRFLAVADQLGKADALLGKLRETALEPIDKRPGSLLFMNVHPSQFGSELLLEADDDFSRAARRIVLEMSEQHHMSDGASGDHTIAELKARGFRLAVDDLGAGYSGLTTFAQIGPDFIKLDGALVRDSGKQWQKQRVIGGVCDIAHELGMEVIAEAVEKQSEFEMLRGLGCDYFQGYFVGRPEPLA